MIGASADAGLIKYLTIKVILLHIRTRLQGLLDYLLVSTILKILAHLQMLYVIVR